MISQAAVAKECRPINDGTLWWLGLQSSIGQECLRGQAIISTKGLAASITKKSPAFAAGLKRVRKLSLNKGLLKNEQVISLFPFLLEHFLFPAVC